MPAAGQWAEPNQTDVCGTGRHVAAGSLSSPLLDQGSLSAGQSLGALFPGHPTSTPAGPESRSVQMPSPSDPSCVSSLAILFFFSLTATFLPLLYCLSFVLFFILKNSASLITLVRLLRIMLKKKKKRRQPHLLLKLVLKFKISKIHKRHHNRPETNQKKNNRWSFFTAARPSPGSSRCHFLPSFLSQWHAKFMVILRSRYPCKQTSLIFLYNWLILLTPTYLSAWGWVEKSSN